MNNMIKNSLVGAVSMLAMTGVNASIISVDPISQIVQPGSSFSATVQADFSDVAAGASGGGFRVTWDTSLLTLNAGASNESAAISGSRLGQFFNNGGDAGFSITTVDAAAGTLDYSFTTCPLAFPCDTLSVFDVYDLTFDVNPNASGSTPLGLGIDAINDPWLLGSNGLPASVDPTYVGATVVVSGVPVPASVWLFGSGLLGLIGVARRRLNARPGMG